MRFGKSPVSSFCGEGFFFFKKMLTNTHMHAHTHARTWLSLSKYIINRIIKEICVHKFNLPKFDVVIVCTLAMRLHKAPKGSNSHCFQVI